MHDSGRAARHRPPQQPALALRLPGPRAGWRRTRDAAGLATPLPAGAVASRRSRAGQRAARRRSSRPAGLDQGERQSPAWCWHRRPSTRGGATGCPSSDVAVDASRPGAPAAGAPAQAAGVAGVGWPCLRRAWRREPLRPRRGRCGIAMSECRPGPRPMTRPPDSRRRGAAVATASPTGRSEGRLSRYISRRASRSATQSCPSRPARALPRFWRITQRTSGSGDPIHRSRARRPSSGSATAATHQQ